MTASFLRGRSLSVQELKPHKWTTTLLGTLFYNQDLLVVDEEFSRTKHKLNAPHKAKRLSREARSLSLSLTLWLCTSTLSPLKFHSPNVSYCNDSRTHTTTD
jgi:hypothetical protein